MVFFFQEKKLLMMTFEKNMPLFLLFFFFFDLHDLPYVSVGEDFQKKVTKRVAGISASFSYRSFAVDISAFDIVPTSSWSSLYFYTFSSHTLHLVLCPSVRPYCFFSSSPPPPPLALSPCLRRLLFKGVGKSCREPPLPPILNETFITN